MNCLNCQREIENGSRKKFCNRKCRAKMYNAPRDLNVVEMGRDCKHCGKHFFPEKRQRLLCSTACRQRAYQLAYLKRNVKRKEVKQIEVFVTTQNYLPVHKFSFPGYQIEAAKQIQETFAKNMHKGKIVMMPEHEVTVGDYSLLFPTPVMGYRVKKNQ